MTDPRRFATPADYRRELDRRANRGCLLLLGIGLLEAGLLALMILFIG